MKTLRKMNNFIIAMLLVMFIVSGFGIRFEENSQVCLLYSDVHKSEITTPTISVTDNLHTFQVSERISANYQIRSLRDNRIRLFSRGSLASLCVLAILLVFFRLLQKIYVYYSRLYVQDRYHIIFFIEDMDGRKRIS